MRITEALRIHLVHELGEAEAQRISAQVVQNDHRNGKQRGSHEQLRTVGRDNHADDKQNGHLGHDRQSDRDLLYLLAENGMADHAKSDREQHHLNRIEEQGFHRNRHILGSEPLHQQRNHERRAQRGQNADGHIQRHIATAQIAHHVGRGSGRAAADQNHTDGERTIKTENPAQQHSHQRHDDEVGHGADDDHQRLGENALEIVEGQGKTHTEQHDTQEITGIGLAPQACLRHEIVEHGPHNHNRGEPLGKPITKRFDLLHEYLFLHTSQLFGR